MSDVDEVVVVVEGEKQAQEENGDDVDGKEDEAQDGIEGEEAFGDVERIASQFDDALAIASTNANFQQKPPRDFPASYRLNTEKEKETLGIVNNFSRQFKKLYKQRKPIQCVFTNECDVQKFASTTIRPTLLPYEKMRTMEGIAMFVSDFIAYDQLENPTEMPSTLESPATTLYYQHGTSVNMSVVMVSLLEGAGYDAYVVYGYATKEVTTCSSKRKDKLKVAHVEKKEEKKKAKKKNKYAIKMEEKLKSMYDDDMLNREREKQRREEEERAKQLEEERKRRLLPAEDELSGLRVHSWVLVLPGKRGVVEPCFIEPTTGLTLFVDDPNYVGVESVWNSKNYWVNMQRCEFGLKDMLFDLNDTSHWEYILPLDDDVGGAKVDVPTSWVEELSVSLSAYELRCPNGMRRVQLLNETVEVFAEYINKDGLVRRVTLFDNEELKNVRKITNTYKHRKDKLVKYTQTFPVLQNDTAMDFNRNSNEDEDEDDEFVVSSYEYENGHPFKLKQHSFATDDSGTVVKRTFLFFDDARVDGLKERTHIGDEMIREVFAGRNDRLQMRETTFVGENNARRVGFVDEQQENEVEFILEKYNKDPILPAHKCIDEIIYYSEDIQIKFHRSASDVSAATLDLEKPQISEKQEVKPIVRENVSHFTPKTTNEELKNFQLYDWLQKCLKMESAAKKSVKMSLKETEAIIDRVDADNEVIDLHISFYDTMRNEKSRIARAQKERAAREAAEHQARQAEDYLAPYLVKVEDPNNIDSVTAAWLKDQVMNDLTRSLKKRFHYIEEECAKESKALETKTLWFKQNQSTLSNEEEKEFAKFRNESLFRLNILQKRLAEHKERTPRISMEMEHRLRSDERLRALHG
eukprot:m.109159 g.109159  ORF g.109159 m.109159 type:complete len:864 (+) comp12728_c1_seq1:62-2653(+)